MRNKLLTLILFGSIFNLTTNAQKSFPSDTANYPYWIEMMSDPSVNFYKTQRAFNLYWENRPIEKGSGFKPFKRWEYSMLEIIDSNGNIPKPGVLEAEIERYQRSRYGIGSGSGSYPGIPGAPVGAPCLTTGNWVELGPRRMPSNKTSQPNGLGRINALGFHPTDSNIIYAGAPAGGVWVTQDGGKTWSTGTDTLATLGISAIAIDPQYPDTVYIGTGDRDGSDSYGRGVWKSTDAGLTWSLSNSGMGNVTVGRLIIDPNNTQTLLAATNSGIYRTTNGGSSWSRVLNDNMREIVFDAVNSDFIYAASYSKAEFYRSTDNGVNWTKITNGIPNNEVRMVIAVTPADSNLVYALITESRVFAGLYLSKDRGSSFKLMSDTPNIMDYSHLGSGTGGQAWYDLDIAVDPNDASIVYGAGVNIFQSTDSGKSWKINAHWVGNGGAPDVHADNHVLEYRPGSDVLYTGNDGGIYFTQDRGKNWTEISDGMGIAQIYRLGQSTLNPNYVINGYQDNGTGSYLNGSWFTIMGGDGMDCVINPSDDTWSYSALYYGDIRRHKNNSYNGTIGKNGVNGIDEAGGWVTPFILREGNPDHMFAGYKNVWRSKNVTSNTASSVTWDKISNNIGGSNTRNITLLENSSVDDDLLYMARSDNKFFKTENANAAAPNWTDLTSSLPTTGGIQWIETHRKFRDRVWICLSNKVYQSDDGGSNWTNISSGLPNIPILSLVFDSSSSYQGMYAGTYMGVFYKDTTMSNWTWFNDNMPINTRVRDIEIYYSPSGRSKSHVVCATYGRGNWQSPLYDEDQYAPIAGYSSDAPSICQNQVVQFTDTSLYAPTRWSWEITPSTYSYINKTDSTSQNPQVRFTAKGKYSIKFWAANCQGVDSVEKTNYIEVFDAVTAAKCPGITTNIGGYGIGIYNVEINGNAFPSYGPNVEGGYLDWACKNIIPLKTDTGYFTTITTGTTYNEYVKVFIDFNNDGDMDDAGEMVFDTPRAKTNHQDTIHIPVNPTTNTLLRMRVMSDFDTIPGNACDTLRYGQTEDYGVIIEPRIPTPHFVIDTNRICRNGKIVLTDSSEGSIYNQRWYLGNYGALTYQTDSSGPITFTLPDTGWYFAMLVLNDSIVSKRIDSIVYVQPVPTATLSTPFGNAQSCSGDSLVLANGGNPASLVQHRWFRNNLLLIDDTLTNLTIGKLATTDTGTYYSEVDWNGCIATTSDFVLKINPKPTANFTVDDTSDCFINNQFRFANSSTISSGSLTYNWDFGDGNSSNQLNPIISITDTGTFTVKLIAKTSFCSDSLSQNIVVHESPVAGFTFNSSPQCENENLFELTNQSTLQSGVVNYYWDFGDGDTSTAQEPNHSYSVSGTFDITLIAKSSYCQDTLIRNIQVYPSPIADFNIIQNNLCGSDNSFDFTDNSSISSGSIDYQTWIFPDQTLEPFANVTNHTLPDTGFHDVMFIARSNLGCRDTIVKPVQVFEKPIADFTISPASSCLNGNDFAVSNSSFISSGSLSYEWSFGDGSTDFTANPASKAYASDGMFEIELIITSDQGCKDTARNNVEVYPMPIVDFTGGNGCIGEPIQFTNNSTLASGSISEYEWSMGDGSIKSLENPTHTYKKDGNFEVKLKVATDKGCVDSFSLKNAAEISPLPNANFSHERLSSIGTSSEIAFTDLSDSAIFWEWSFDGNGSSFEQNPVVTFADSGTFSIMLFVENREGCKDTIIKPVFIFPNSEFFLPNSFSPNGDGINEEMKPIGIGYVRWYKMSIYNRWGEKVFETDNPQTGWDGKYLNEAVTPGIYMISIEYIDLENNRTRMDQTIRVMR